MTEAIGGVPVCLKRPEREVRSGVDLPAGPQMVRGADALAFVRQRHGLEDGDLDRIARQQAFLAGLAQPDAVDRDAVRPGRGPPRSWTRSPATSCSTAGGTWTRLIAQFGRMSGGDIRFLTIPTGSPALRDARGRHRRAGGHGRGPRLRPRHRRRDRHGGGTDEQPADEPDAHRGTDRVRVRDGVRRALGRSHQRHLAAGVTCVD